MNFLVESVEVKDLKEGDEVLVPSQSSFRYFKILKDSKVSKKERKPWWKPGYVDYSAVKCSTKVIETKYQRTYGFKTYDYIDKIYEITPDNHNVVMYVNLNRCKLLKVIK